MPRCPLSTERGNKSPTHRINLPEGSPLLWHVDVRWNTSLYVPSNTRWGLRSIILVSSCQVFSSRGYLPWAHTGETDSFKRFTEGNSVLLFLVCVFIYKLYLYWTCAGETDVISFCCSCKSSGNTGLCHFGLYILISNILILIIKCINERFHLVTSKYLFFRSTILWNEWFEHL